jgi:hypothetical protein
MAEDFGNNNDKVFRKILKKRVRGLEDRIVKVLTDLAKSVVMYVEGSGQIPVYTGNLADSTGVGVYRNGRLTSYAPTKRALEPQSYKEQTVWGYEELDQALVMASTDFSNGIWIVLFSAVPYAVKLEGKYDYFEGGVVKDMLGEFKRIVKAEFPNFKV